MPVLERSEDQHFAKQYICTWDSCNSSKPDLPLQPASKYHISTERHECHLWKETILKYQFLWSEWNSYEKSEAQGFRLNSYFLIQWYQQGSTAAHKQHMLALLNQGSRMLSLRKHAGATYWRYLNQRYISNLTWLSKMEIMDRAFHILPSQIRETKMKNGWLLITLTSSTVKNEIQHR